MTLSFLWTSTVALIPALNKGTRQSASPVRALTHTTLPSPVAEKKTRLPPRKIRYGCEYELSLGRSPGLAAQTTSPVFFSKAEKRAAAGPYAPQLEVMP